MLSLCPNWQTRREEYTRILTSWELLPEGSLLQIPTFRTSPFRESGEQRYEEDLWQKRDFLWLLLTIRKWSFALPPILQKRRECRRSSRREGIFTEKPLLQCLGRKTRMSRPR